VAPPVVATPGLVTARAVAPPVVAGLGAAATVGVADLAAKTATALIVGRLRAATPRTVVPVVVTSPTDLGRWLTSRIALAVQQGRPGGDPNRDIFGEGSVPDQSD
jgi:hypothetical protein